MKLAHTLAMTAVAVAALALGAIAAQPTLAQPMSEKTVMVGGAAMYPSKNIIDNAMKSKEQHAGGRHCSRRPRPYQRFEL